MSAYRLPSVNPLTKSCVASWLSNTRGSSTEPKGSQNGVRPIESMGRTPLGHVSEPVSRRERTRRLQSQDLPEPVSAAYVRLNYMLPFLRVFLLSLLHCD